MNVHYRWLLSICLLLLPMVALCQNKWGITNTANTSSGLPSDEVLSLLFDSKGKLWISTNLALATYDGTTWKTYTPKDGLQWQNVRLGRLRIDSQQNVWVCSDENGLARISPNGNVTMFSESQSPNAKSLASNILFDIAEDENGGYWISNWQQGGTILSYLSPNGEFTHYPFNVLGNNPFDKLLTLVYDNKTKTLYGGSLFQGIVKWNGRKFEPITDKFQTAISEMVFDADNKNLYAASDIGLIHYSLLDNNVGLLTTNEGLADNFSSSLAIAKDGTLWVGTDGNGVTCIKPDGSTIIYNRKSGLTSNDIFSIALDDMGKPYLGTHTGGVCFLNNKNRWEHYSATGLAGNDVLDILFDYAGCVWYATTAGLSAFDGALWKNFLVKKATGNEFTSNYIASVCPNLNDEMGKSLIIGTKGGIVLLNTENGVCSYYPLGNVPDVTKNNSTKIKAYQFEKDKVWLCSFGARLGFGIFDPITKKFSWFNDTNIEVLPKGTNSFFEIKKAPNGQVWLGSVNGALVYDKGMYTWIDFTTRAEVINPDTGEPQVVADNNVRNFAFAPDGKIWVSKLSDLVIYDPVTKTKTVEKGPKGATMSALTSIAFDGNANAFIGTLLDGLFLRTKNGAYYHLTTAFGLSEKLMVYNVYFHNEKLILATDAGIYVSDKPADLVQQAEHVASPVTSTFKLIVYPNPAVNTVNLPIGAEYFVIYDIMGRVIKSGNVSSSYSIDVRNIKRGSYIIKFLLDKNWHQQQIQFE